MKDIKIGRHCRTVISNVAVGVTAAQLCQNNPNRIGLIIFPAGTHALTIGDNPNIVAAQGPTIQSASVALYLDIREYGQGVCNPWWGIVPTGTDNVGIIEVILDSLNWLLEDEKNG